MRLPCRCRDNAPGFLDGDGITVYGGQQPACSLPECRAPQAAPYPSYRRLLAR
jgi:hypothetical protein